MCLCYLMVQDLVVGVVECLEVVVGRETLALSPFLSVAVLKQVKKNGRILEKTKNVDGYYCPFG